LQGATEVENDLSPSLGRERERERQTENNRLSDIMNTAAARLNFHQFTWTQIATTTSVSAVKTFSRCLLTTTWRQMQGVDVKSEASCHGCFSTRVKSPRYALKRRLVGSHNRSGRGDEKVTLTQPGIEFQTPSSHCQSCSVHVFHKNSFK